MHPLHRCCMFPSWLRHDGFSSSATRPALVHHEIMQRGFQPQQHRILPTGKSPVRIDCYRDRAILRRDHSSNKVLLREPRRERCLAKTPGREAWRKGSRRSCVARVWRNNQFACFPTPSHAWSRIHSRLVAASDGLALSSASFLPESCTIPIS